MPFLDLLLWAARALSLFNTIAFLWLGLAVLLNAQRRVAGTWITGGGLLLAALFFAVHSTLVGRDPADFEAELAFWWRPAWLLFLGPPYLWYAVIAWYMGALSSRSQRLLLAGTGLLGLVALALLAVPALLPGYGQPVRGGAPPLLSVGGCRQPPSCTPGTPRSATPWPWR